MRKVITGSLRGNAYQFEEEAFEAVSAYLASAERKLAGNLDRAEILGDLEQAIADKCDTFLGRNKTVISSEEAGQILREMGPVDGNASEAEPAAASAQSFAGTAPAAGAATAPTPGRKRLFRLPSEGMMGGVCSGLAAYAGVDVVWVRLGYVLLTFTTGIWFFVWLTQLIITPSATTPEQMAAARGETLNAREVMEMAKRKSAEFGKSAAAGLEDAGRNLKETFGGGKTG